MVEPARAAGRLKVEICARDVIRALRLRNRTPAICGALDAAVFSTQARAKHISRSGPRFGATAQWELTLAPSPMGATAKRLVATAVRSLTDDRSPSPGAPAAQLSAAEFLDDARRKTIRLLRPLISPSVERVDFGEQVRRLVEAKKIPFVTGKLIHCLLAVRNSVVYHDRRL